MVFLHSYISVTEGISKPMEMSENMCINICKLRIDADGSVRHEKDCKTRKLRKVFASEFFLQNNVGIAIINYQFLMVYTTHIW